jgi:hypothetical protein
VLTHFAAAELGRSAAEGLVVERTEARAKVMRFLKTIPHTGGKGRWVIREEDTLDHELFWMFSWTTSRSIWPHRRVIAMAGNVPLAVSKADGRMYAWGLLYPFEEFVSRFRRGELPEVVDAEQGDAADRKC